MVFDIVLADPPYASNADCDLAANLLSDSRLSELLSDDGLVVIEVEAERENPVVPGWKVIDRRVYGSSAILFYAWQESR